MAGTCCGRRAARVTIEGINEGIDGLRESMESPSGAAGLERDPNCECDPCMCPSDDVPCNARYLGDDLSDRGLKQALDRLVRHARQIQAARVDACDCADRPPLPQVEEFKTPERPVIPPATPSPIPLVDQARGPAVRPERPRAPFVFRLSQFPSEIRDIIYEFYFADARRLLTEIAAVRVRQDRAGSETRIRRYLRNAPDRERRRFILDHRYQHQKPIQWTTTITTVQREQAATTYEAHAGDDELAELPSDPLALLRVSREVLHEAGAVFFRSFRFTHPRNRLPQDDALHHGILAAEAFLTNRSANMLRQIRHIELDLGVRPRLRGGPTSDIGNDSLTQGMMRDMRIGGFDWTNGLDRLGILSNILRPMEFRHLTLNFTGQPPRWWEEGVTDPRNPRPNFSSPVAPWAVDLFNVGPRSRLRLQLHFRYEQLHRTTRDPGVTRNNYPLYDAVRTLSIIRRFLLINAQAMEDRYAGIRVIVWAYDWDVRFTRPAEVLVECDDEYLERSGSIVSRLQDRTFGVTAAPRQPDFNKLATEFPKLPTEFTLPYVPPMRPPSPPAPPERSYWDDDEDERDPSILGP